MKRDVIDGSLIDGKGHPILFSFVLSEPPGLRVFCEPEAVHFKNINKFVLNTVTFYLEDDNHKLLISMEENLLLLYN